MKKFVLLLLILITGLTVFSQGNRIPKGTVCRGAGNGEKTE